MNSAGKIQLIPLLLIISCIAAPNVTAAEPLTEKQKIEALIKNVEDLKDTKFVRNGSEYDAKSAGTFLRGKLRTQQSELKTAQDFIDKAATVSSTSGKPYLIRFKDGKEVQLAEYLKGELKKLDEQK